MQGHAGFVTRAHSSGPPTRARAAVADQQTLPHARDTPPERRAWSQSHGCSANLLKRHAVEGPRLPPAPLTRAGTGAKDSGGDAARGLDPLRNCAGRGAGHCQAGSDQRYAASCCEADGNDGLTARSGGEPLRLITCCVTQKPRLSGIYTLPWATTVPKDPAANRRPSCSNRLPTDAEFHTERYPRDNVHRFEGT